MTTPAPVYGLDADEVQVGTPNGAGIYIAKVGTDPPDDTTEDWGTGWDILGYLSDDGATVAQSTDSEDLTPWQSVAPIRSVITSRSVTLQFVLWQLNPMTLALYFDTDLSTPAADGSLTMDVRTDQAGHIYAVGIDSRDGDRVLRVIFPRASLSDAGDMPLSRGAVVPLDCTLSALETNGSLATIMLGPADDGSTGTNGSGGNGASGRMKPSRNGHTRTDEAHQPNGHGQRPGKTHRRHAEIPPPGEAVAS
jgi:hypothetical protein